MFRPATRKRPSISRWAKDNRDLLRTVQFGTDAPDPRWRHKRAYGRWRNAVLERDQHRCVRCGATRRLTAHHKIPRAVCPALQYEVVNGETLCEKCHEKVPHQFDPAFWEKMVN